MQRSERCTGKGGVHHITHSSSLPLSATASSSILASIASTSSFTGKKSESGFPSRPFQPSQTAHIQLQHIKLQHAKSLTGARVVVCWWSTGAPTYRSRASGQSNLTKQETATPTPKCKQPVLIFGFQKSAPGVADVWGLLKFGIR